MAPAIIIKEMGSHRFEYSGEVEKRDFSVENDNIFIFHVSSRGIYDTINKIQYSQFFSVKRSVNPAKELHCLIFDHKSTNLPNRFKSLAFQSRFREHTLSLNYSFPNLNYVTDTQLLEDITMEGLRNLLKRKINKQDAYKIISKVQNFDICPDLVNLYASKQINILNVIKNLQSSNRSWIAMQIQALKANLVNILSKVVSRIFRTFVR